MGSALERFTDFFFLEATPFQGQWSDPASGVPPESKCRCTLESCQAQAGREHVELVAELG